MQPHAPPQHPPLEPVKSEDDAPEDFAPLLWAAKTESWIVLLLLSHLGHVTFVFPLITMRS